MQTPIALTIAGSDSSAGAGLQADLKTFSSFGVFGLTAVTCVVSETPLTLSRVHPVPPSILQDQVRLLLESYPIGAIKTGMLYSKAHIKAVCELLADTNIPLIVDPVMVASTGDPLMKEDALDTIRESLLPLATIITPNLPEAGILLRKSVATIEDQESAVEELTSIFGVATYLKGGHLENTRTHRDLLKENGKLHVFEHEHLELPQTHGTGCTLSAALAAAISSGSSLAHAGKQAHQFTQQALRDSESWNSPTSGEVIFHLRQAQQLNALTEN